jgi:hypothetical protein
LAIAWDATLPAYFTADEFQGEPPTNTVFNETLSGRFKSQLISTHTSEPVTGSMVLTVAQLSTFKSWYADPTKGNRGNATFQNLNDPFTGSNKVWRFTQKPGWVPYQGGGAFLLKLSLLMLPDAPV